MNPMDGLLFARLYATLDHIDGMWDPDRQKPELVNASNLAAHLAAVAAAPSLRALARGVAGLLWQALLGSSRDDASARVARISMRNWARENDSLACISEPELCSA